MTLILSCLTHDLAIQASDRRLTWLRGPHAGETKDDDQNKAVIFCGATSIAYTGLASLGIDLSVSTDMWIANALRDFAPDQVELAFETIREDATKLFSRLSSKFDKTLLRHAFVGIGWAKFSDDPALQSYEITVTNGQDDRGKWLACAEPTFTTTVRPLRVNESFRVSASGQEIHDAERVDLERVIRRCVERRLGPGAFARVLVAAIRRVAQRNAAVGRRIMITSLPRPIPTGRRDMIILTSKVGMLNSKTPMFMYFREDSSTGTLYGPHFVCGGSMMTNFQAATITEPEHTVPEPPWMSQAIVMSPRTQIYNQQSDCPENIALLTRDFAFQSWSLFASVGNNPPGPCIVQVPANSDELSRVARDKRFFILVRVFADAGRLADDRWLVRLGEWLVREHVERAVAMLFISKVSGWHIGEIVFELRRFFDQLEFTSPVA